MAGGVRFVAVVRISRFTTSSFGRTWAQIPKKI